MKQKIHDSDLDALIEAINFKGKTVIDIGCGDGSKAKRLVSRGASVIGIEPNLESWQVQEFETDDFKVLSGYAEKLDLEDNCADVVVFMYSLHHVPTAHMDSALCEAYRVLKKTGMLYIAEPIAQGSYQDVCESFSNETQIRAEAKLAVEQHAISKFDHCDEFEYVVTDCFDDFAQFVDEMMRYSLGRYELCQVSNNKVKQKFEQTLKNRGSVISFV